MPNARSKNRATPRKKKKVHICGPGREVSANDVAENLHGLFRLLGVDPSEHIDRKPKTSLFITPSHTIYPYASSIGELLTHWHQDSAYLTAEGNPARIRLEGESPSFHQLARRHVPKIDEAYLLSELVRLGAVTIDAKKHASVNMRSFPVYEDKRLAVQHTLTILDGFISTIRHNLQSNPSNSDQLFHRIAWNDDFDAREIPALKIRVKRQGQNFLESFDDWLVSKKTKARRAMKKPSTGVQVSVGVYLAVDENPKSLKK